MVISNFIILSLIGRICGGGGGRFLFLRGEGDLVDHQGLYNMLRLVLIAFVSFILALSE